MSTVREHAQPQRQATVQAGTGQEYPVGGVDPAQESLVVSVTAVVDTAQPEQHSRQLTGVRHLQPRVGGKLSVRPVGQVELLIERRPEGLHTVEVQRQPQPQAAVASGELGSEVCEVGQRAAPQIAQVVGVVGMRGGQCAALADQEHPGAVGQEQTLVRVQTDRVRLLDADQPVPTPLGELEESALTGIDVTPHLVAPS